jgi:hypothetical protein
MDSKEYEDIQSILKTVFSNKEMMLEAVRGNFDLINMMIPEDGGSQESPEMQKFMDDYFVSNIGGKTVVIRRDNIGKQYDFTNFSRLKANIKEKHKVKKIVDEEVVYKVVEKPIVDRFLNDKAERFDDVVFKPSGNISEGEYNFFEGWSYEPVEGDCQGYLDHIKDNICSGDDDLYEYVLDWMAHIIQHPEDKVDKCLVLRGSQGTGKGFFIQEFGALFGKAFHHLTNMGPLVGRFNSELANRLLVFADEITWGGKKSEGSRLKTFISEDVINIEFKGKDVVPMENFSRLVIASNHDWVVPIEGGDRRYVVLDVNDNMKENKSYFSRIHNNMLKGGREALMHILKTRDLTKRDWSVKPKTDAIDDQKMLSLEPHENWIYDCISGNIDDSVIPWALGWNTKIENRDIYSMYKEYMRDNYSHAYIKSSRELSRFLTDLTGTNTFVNNGKRYRTFSTNMQQKFETYAGVGSNIW